MIRNTVRDKTTNRKIVMIVMKKIIPSMITTMMIVHKVKMKVILVMMTVKKVKRPIV